MADYFINPLSDLTLLELTDEPPRDDTKSILAPLVRIAFLFGGTAVCIFSKLDRSISFLFNGFFNF